MSTIFRAVLLGIGLQFVLQQLLNGQSGQKGTPGKPDVVEAGSVVPIWPDRSRLDVRMYVAPTFALPVLRTVPSDALVFDERDVGLGDFADTRTVSTTITVPRQVEDLFVHYLVGQSGADLDPRSPHYDSSRAFSFVRPLTRRLPKRTVVHKRNLLAGTDNNVATPEPSVGAPTAAYYHPNLTIALVPDYGVFALKTVNPAVMQHIRLDQQHPPKHYYPIVHHNTFWQLAKDMTELNGTAAMTLPLNIHLSNEPVWKFSVLAALDESVHTAAATNNAAATDSFEQIKQVLLDGNPILLGITAVATLLHTLFEFLAFKNDVSHWKNRKDNVGVSVRTIVANVVMQTIILLYLLDNNENTNWMILFGQATGIAIEAWKITKAVDVRVRPAEDPSSVIPYRIRFETKHDQSASEKLTDEYDAVAFQYLYKVAIPLLVGYAAYSVKYDTHKSWYSFIIATLVGSVYAYGFLMMVPALYINYRLQSVAHMPRKAMMYKFLNTFIDDLFAFAIKMPILHRLATFRDDIVFFVYLYQAWAYRVDHSRVNEFGQGGGDDESEEPAMETSEKKAVDGSSEKKAVDGPSQPALPEAESLTSDQ